MTVRTLTFIPSLLIEGIRLPLIQFVPCSVWYSLSIEGKIDQCPPSGDQLSVTTFQMDTIIIFITRGHHVMYSPHDSVYSLFCLKAIIDKLGIIFHLLLILPHNFTFALVACNPSMPLRLTGGTKLLAQRPVVNTPCRRYNSTYACAHVYNHMRAHIIIILSQSL